MIKSNPCSLCGSVWHTKAFCPLKPKKPIKKSRLRREAVKTKQKRINTAKEWLEVNPPDENGQWDCYLRISSICLVKVDEITLVREHVKPKGKHPELKYVISNIRPACDPCNELKGSTELEVLAKTYPHLRQYIVDKP